MLQRLLRVVVKGGAFRVAVLAHEGEAEKERSLVGPPLRQLGLQHGLVAPGFDELRQHALVFQIVEQILEVLVWTDAAPDRREQSSRPSSKAVRAAAMRRKLGRSMAHASRRQPTNGLAGVPSAKPTLHNRSAQPSQRRKYTLLVSGKSSGTQSCSSCARKINASKGRSSAASCTGVGDVLRFVDVHSGRELVHTEELERRAEEAARLYAEEARLRQEEARLHQEQARRLRAAEAEIKRLRGELDK